MNRNIRDVLAHLHHWHLMMANRYKEGMSEHKPEMPAKGYTWKIPPELNQKIRDDYQPLSKARKSFEKSHKEVIEKHSHEELFEKKRYKRSGSTSPEAHLISATSSH